MREWIDGAPLTDAKPMTGDRDLAYDLAAFLRPLGAADAKDGPAAGPHSFHRGGSLRVYDAEARAAPWDLQGKIDHKAALRIWERTLSSTWSHPPVWAHGDVAAGNLLLRQDRLVAVIDFGSSSVGDPACDLVPAWTILSEAAASVFRDQLPYDGDTWERARGWALWKAAITVEGYRTGAAAAERTLHRVLAEP